LASVEFINVTKIYPNGTRAISGLDLKANDGELLVFVGPSGCGKSTLLRMLAGLESISEGQILIDGRVVNALTPQQRNIAMVFQDYALYPHMSVRKNLEFPLRMRGLPARQMQQRVDWAAALLELTELLDRLPKQLSGGQRQRVAMGRALVREPAVFLLDEPLSNLDAKLRVQVRAEIGELQRRTGATMIYVTHDQVEAMTLGHRVAVFHQGYLQQVSTPQELYRSPANVFVAGFIGNPPMNLFPTRLTIDTRGHLLMSMGAQSFPLPLLGEAVARLQPYIGQPMTGGLRPEAFAMAVDKPLQEVLSATVNTVEYLGHETLAHLNIGSKEGETKTLIARIAGMQPRSPGQRIQIDMDVSRLHLFDSSGQAVMILGEA
jgi:multiple sugar transport system ATP-binding protein